MMNWDIFCRVIDNFGDIGVSWRLACDLARRAQCVRLWVDDPSPLAWLAPQGAAGVEVRRWSEPLDLRGVAAGDALVEAFGCDVPQPFVAIFSEAARTRCACACGNFRAWINLEYLSAEPFAESAHALPSPVQHGAGAGLTKHFFYPGFTPRSGGLIREPDLRARQARFDRERWLAALGIEAQDRRLVSLFCYEPPALAALLERLASSDAQRTLLLVTRGRAAAAVRSLMRDANARGALDIVYLPWLAQRDFDHLLWACDVNFVRGEDSLVRALWAARPFVWQIYPQHDGAHAAKLDAFLDRLDAPAALIELHRAWNGLSCSAALSLPDLDIWREFALAARARLLEQDDLTTRLLRFVGGKDKI